MIKRFLRTITSCVLFLILIVFAICAMFAGVSMFIAGLTGIYMALGVAYVATLWKYALLAMAGALVFVGGFVFAICGSDYPIR